MKRVPMAEFGQDHWSTFGYVEVRIVENGGKVEDHHLRCIVARHPLQSHSGGDATNYPTRAKGGRKIPGHDDWDCFEDMIAAGLLVNKGPSFCYAEFALTDLGRTVAGLLREHKGQGGTFATFSYPKEEAVTA